MCVFCTQRPATASHIVCGITFPFSSLNTRVEPFSCMQLHSLPCSQLCILTLGSPRTAGGMGSPFLFSLGCGLVSFIRLGYHRTKQDVQQGALAWCPTGCLISRHRTTRTDLFAVTLELGALGSLRGFRPRGCPTGCPSMVSSGVLQQGVQRGVGCKDSDPRLGQIGKCAANFS